MHHRTHFDCPPALLQALKRLVHILQWNFRQKAQRTQVHAQHRDSRLRYRPGGSEQSPITTQHHHKVQGTSSDFLARDGLSARSVGRGFRIDRYLILVLAKPRDQFGNDGRQFRFTRLGDDMVLGAMVNLNCTES
jgi:hypothetical protein